MIPAFSGISGCMFYLRAFSPSVETAYDQFKEIELNKIEEKLLLKIKRIIKNLDIKKLFNFRKCFIFV